MLYAKFTRCLWHCVPDCPQYLITITLSGTVALDMCITLGLMHYLRMSKNEFSR